MKKFDDFRFEGLNPRQETNKYLTMNRVSDDRNKIVVKISESHLIQTRYGFALILDCSHVVFLKEWQVSINYYGIEVLLTREYFNVKEWGEFDDFDEEEENLNFDSWLEVAKAQEEHVETRFDEDGEEYEWRNIVKWESHK